MKSAQQMFGKIARDAASAEKARLDDIAERQRRADEAEARLDETLTRREVIEAIESVANDYGCNGTQESDTICEAFRRLAVALK